MELSMISMYWLVKLDDIRSLLSGFSFFSLLVLVIGGVFFIVFMLIEDKLKYLKKFIVCFIIVFLLTITLFTSSALIPSTKQMAAIVVFPKIINNKKVQELPDKIMDLSTAWLEELKPDKKTNIENGSN